MHLFHYVSTSPIDKNRRYWIIALSAIGCLLVSGAITAYIVVNQPKVSVHSAATSSTHIQKVVPVQQPLSAKQVSDQLYGGGFIELGPYPMGGVVDSGSFYLGTDKYAVDTFTSKSNRDSWLKIATKLGVDPQWESDTAVVYPSLPNG